MPGNSIRGRGRSRRGRKNYRRRQPIVMPRSWRSPDPPSFNPVPWVNMTIEFQYLTLMHDIPGVLTISDITTAITDRLGITVNDGNWTVVQLSAIAVWETTGAGITLTDMRNNTFNTSQDDFAVAYITVAPENAADSTKVHVYLKLRWRTSKASSTPVHACAHPMPQCSNAYDRNVSWVDLVEQEPSRPEEDEAIIQELMQNVNIN